MSSEHRPTPASAASLGHEPDASSTRPASPRIQCATVGPFQENCYLFAADGELAVIDPGDEAERLASAISALVEETGAKPRYVLLTHAHLDHVGAAAALAERFEMRVVAPEGERELLEMLPMQCQLFGLPPLPVPAVDQWLTDEPSLPFGQAAFEIVPTPGHTPAGTSYRWGDHVFVGDTIFAGGVGRTDLWGGSWPVLEAAITQRLFTLPDPTVLYPGHGPTTTVGDEKLSNPFFS